MGFPRHGEVSEWLKEHAWKACVGETQPWVRIPPSPPDFQQLAQCVSFKSEFCEPLVLSMRLTCTYKYIDIANAPWDSLALARFGMRFEWDENKNRRNFASIMCALKLPFSFSTIP